MDLIQASLISLLQNGQQVANATANPNATETAGDCTALPPLNLSSILSFLLSFAALRDWLKLFVIGGIIETSRRCGLRLWAAFIESFWLTACFDDNDTSFIWALYWLLKQPTWKKARMIDISTHSLESGSAAISVDGDEDSDEGRSLSYLPSFSKTYTVWFKGHYIRVTRSQVQEGVYRTKEVLHFDILARNHAVLNGLLLEAKSLYIGAQAHLVSIFVSEVDGKWRQVASRPKRSMKSIILDPGIKDLLLDDAKDFLQSEDWYAKRGVPFRRGYLLYGAPGSGKTSMIHSLAGELGLDVYIISLSRADLDDTSLSTLIAELPRRCIALMEDIDAAFHHGLTRNLQDELDTAGKHEHNNNDGEREKQRASVSSPLSRVTLSGLLNALDGVGAQEGRILYATTNRYSALDPALCRPGRMDLHVQFRLASRYQAQELFKCFYLPSHSQDDTTDSKNEGEKAATESEHDDHDPDYESGSLADETTPSDDRETKDTTPLRLYEGQRHRSTGPKLSYSRINVLAQRFADNIPEREFSMASLQGYLMAYKVRPIEAVESVAAWVEAERVEKARKNENCWPNS